MLKILVIPLVVSLGSAAVAAPQASAGSRPQSAQNSTDGKHCLWRITNAKAPFYLLGSIHTLRDTDYPLAPVIEQAIQQSQDFYFEFDPKRSDDYHRRIEAASRLPRGVEIKDKVHEKTWNYLRSTARGGNFDWVHLKAWAIARSVLNYPVHEPLSAAFGLDNTLRRKPWLVDNQCADSKAWTITWQCSPE